MQGKMIGMELVATANALRRMTFQETHSSILGADSPTSMQQWFLAYIWEHHTYNDVFQKDIEAAFKIRRSTATEILKAMERKNLIVRVLSEEDKRNKKIMLTDKAIAVCEENHQKIAFTEKQIIQGLSQTEIQTFFEVLHKIQKNIDTM